MDLLIVTDGRNDSGSLVAAAVKANWRVVMELAPDELAQRGAQGMTADAAVFLCERIEPAPLRALQALSAARRLPVVVITRDARPGSIQAAVQAGATGYVIDCADPNRIGALLEVARVRFREQQQLRSELHKAKTSLAERKYVDRAKAILMQQRHLNEEQAYQTLRKLAMSRNKRLGEVASDIILAAEVLI
jgi:response regulator NasT